MSSERLVFALASALLMLLSLRDCFMEMNCWRSGRTFPLDVISCKLLLAELRQNDYLHKCKNVFYVLYFIYNERVFNVLFIFVRFFSFWLAKFLEFFNLIKPTKLLDKTSRKMI